MCTVQRFATVCEVSTRADTRVVRFEKFEK